jgi:AcrR family transcriptional regulator
VSSSTPAPSRRERLRAEALAEIRALALEQIAAGGPEALSLNAIARSMGMSGPAIYRYFASRDALLTALVADLYDDLAGALEAAERAASGRSPAARLRALADGYRAWAHEHPRAYRLLFGAGAPGEGEDPREVVAAAQRSMDLFIDSLGALAPQTAPARSDGRDALSRSLRRWATDRGLDEGVPTVVLRLGLVAWSRLHGIVSLELEGTYRAMGVDAGALYRAEVDQLAREASAG